MTLTDLPPGPPIVAADDPPPIAEDRPRARREPPPPLSRRLDLVRGVLLAVFVFAAGVLIQLTVLSSLQQRADQQRLFDSFREQLAAGTAPTGPTDFDGVPVPLGAPVAYLEVPEIDLRQVVVSGTTSGALTAGPGHRRDTVLPGQAGATVIMGRSSAYGAPFADIASLEEGDRLTVTTGQRGDEGYEYTVVGVRREGDPLPTPPGADDSRLVLTTSEGPPFLPHSVVRVDAELTEPADASSGRLFGLNGLPAAEESMAGDTSQLWALALWLQVLLATSLAAVWSWQRWGRPQTWVVFVPALTLVGMLVTNQAARLLPNML